MATTDDKQERLNELRYKLSNYSRHLMFQLTCISQLFTPTPEEHVYGAWRCLDPTTHMLSRLSPAKSMLGNNEDDQPSTSDKGSTPKRVRVKFFLNSDLNWLATNHCIYTDFTLETDGSLNLKRVRRKWGLWDSQMVYKGRAGSYEVVFPRNRDSLSPQEVRFLLDFEGALRVVENPPKIIRLYREYRYDLLRERSIWIGGPGWKPRQARLACYTRTVSKAVYGAVSTATMRAIRACPVPGYREGKAVFLFAIHLLPLCLLYWLEYSFSSATWKNFNIDCFLITMICMTLYMKCPRTKKPAYIVDGLQMLNPQREEESSTPQ